MMLIACAALATGCARPQDVSPANNQPPANTPVAEPEPEPEPEPDQPSGPLSQRELDLANRAYTIIRENCWGCHGEPGRPAYGETVPLDWILEYDRLLEHKLVIPNSAGKSRLIRITLLGDMPRAYDERGLPSKRALLDTDLIDELIEWINAGAPRWE